jgi:predicted CopG family antitoxin
MSTIEIRRDLFRRIESMPDENVEHLYDYVLQYLEPKKRKSLLEDEMIKHVLESEEDIKQGRLTDHETFKTEIRRWRRKSTR